MKTDAFHPPDAISLLSEERDVRASYEPEFTNYGDLLHFQRTHFSIQPKIVPLEPGETMPSNLEAWEEHRRNNDEQIQRELDARHREMEERERRRFPNRNK